MKDNIAAVGKLPDQLSKHKLATICSYLDQIYGHDSRQTLLAAQALGNLHSFLPVSLQSNAPKLALELGAWDALLHALQHSHSLDVQEAAAIAISQLVTIKEDLGTGFSIRGQIKQLAKSLLTADVLEQLANILTISNSSRTVISIARLAAVLGQSVHAGNDITLLASPLLRALLAVIAQASRNYDLRESVVCALSTMTLMVRSQALYQAGLRHGMLASLASLYERSIDRGMPLELVLPSDVCGLILRVAALKAKVPTKVTAAAANPGAAWRTMAQKLISSGTLDCLVSYMAVEAGNVGSVLCATAHAGSSLLKEILEAHRAALLQLDVQVAGHKQMLKQLRNQLEQCDAAATQDIIDTDIASLRQRAHRCKQQLKQLKGQQRAMQQQQALLVSTTKFLERFTDSHAQEATKVKRSQPNLHILKQAVQVVQELVLQPSARADKDESEEQQQLTLRVQHRLLSSGILTACKRLSTAMAAAGDFSRQLVALLSGLGLPGYMQGLLAKCRGAVAGDTLQLKKVMLRIKTRLHQVHNEQRRAQKSLASGIPQGTPRKHVQLTGSNLLSPGVRAADVAARCDELEDEDARLAVTMGDVSCTSTALQEYAEMLSTAAEQLESRCSRFYKTFPEVCTADATTPIAAAPTHLGWVGPNLKGPKHLDASVWPSEDADLDTLNQVTYLTSQLIDTLETHLASMSHPASTSARLQLLLDGMPSGSDSTATSSCSTTSLTVGRSIPKRPVSAITGSSSRKDGPGIHPTPFFSASYSQNRQPKTTHAFTSMYSQVRFTQSPLRGDSAPSNRLSSACNSGYFVQSDPYSLQGNSHDNTQAAVAGGAVDHNTDGLPQQAAEALNAVRNSVLLRCVGGSMGSQELFGYSSCSGSPTCGSTQWNEKPSQAAAEPDTKAFGANATSSANALGATLLELLMGQADQFGRLLNHVSALQRLSSDLGKQARQLPASFNYSHAIAPLVERQTPDLMHMFVQSLQHDAGHQVAAAEAVAAVAGLGVVPEGHHHRVYLRTGVVDSLVRMLHPGGHVPDRASAKQQGDVGIRAGEANQQPQADKIDSNINGRRKLVNEMSEHDPSANDYRDVKQQLSPPACQSRQIVAEQAAAAQALRTIGASFPQALTAVAQDDVAVVHLVKLCLDHSLQWQARMEAACLLSSLLLAGRDVAVVALKAGCFVALVEVMDRDMYPYYRQNKEGAKEAVVEALAFLAGSEDMRQSVVDCMSDNQVSHTYPLALSTSDDVLRTVLRALWAVCSQLHELMSVERTGNGKYVRAELIQPLSRTATVAALQLGQLADTNRSARYALKEMGVAAAINVTFLQSIKDPALYGGLMALKDKLTPAKHTT